LSFEAANPRHAHEWTVFETIKVSGGKLSIIESKSNFIEHLELIAQRIGPYAALVGRENIIAGSDCGFRTFVGLAAIDPAVVLKQACQLGERGAPSPLRYCGKSHRRRIYP
jgi:5-methyltetrahydropteroyltriglutamate--homocysteine methyltransferase